MTVLTTVEAGEGSGEKGGGEEGGEGERENGVKRARNEITFIHQFPRSPNFVSRFHSVLHFTLAVGDLGTTLSSATFHY